MLRLTVAGLLSVIAFDASAAQRSIVTGSMLYRYNGDTIWIERDTNVTRTVFRGDTIEKATWLNDVRRTSQTYVAEGDSARLIATVDQSGRSLPVNAVTRRLPLEVLTMERRTLEMNLRMEATMARVAASGAMAAFEPPVYSDTVRRYAPSGGVQIMQYRDTLKYIRGCPGARIDTTTFVLFKGDSLKRVAPERMFGRAMAVSLLSAMRYAISQERMKTFAGPVPTDLPRAPDTCK